MNLLEKAEHQNYQRQIDALRAKLNSELDKREATIRKNGELIQENQDLRARVTELEAENAILRAHRCEVGMEDPGAMLEHLESLSTEELEEINQSINRR